jgi:hypothetical protein
MAFCGSILREVDKSTSSIGLSDNGQALRNVA